MADEKCWFVWEVLSLSSSSGIILLLKLAGAASLILRPQKPENKVKSMAHRARQTPGVMRQELGSVWD